MKNRIFSSLFSRLPLSSLLLSFLTLFAASVASAQIPSSGLVGYWPFNGNANDESGNGNNGTVNGATLTTDRFGNVSSAYNFDGVNDFIDAGSFYNFGTANFTVSCWFKLVPTSTNASLVSKREVNMWGNWWVQEVNGFQIDESAQSSILTLTHPTPLNKQLWTNYIIVREGNILSFYVNGVLSDQETLPTAYNMSNNANLLFGTTFVDGSYVGLLKGKLDDISIYNRAIDSEEISSLFTTTTSTVATPPCPTLATNLQIGLVGYWPFCGNANDESGNGNNGTVNGATLTTDRFGNANSAYSFNNLNDFITVSNPNPILTNTTKSISCWIKLPNQYNYSSLALVKHGTNYSTGFNLGLDQNNGAYGNNNYLVFSIAGNGGSVTFISNQSELGNWVHLVSTYDGTDLKIYLNGMLQSTQPFTGNLNCPNDIIYFGKWDNLTAPAIVARQMDDILLYNRALTPAEISQLYTNPSTTPPVACTPFLGEDQTVCAGTSVTLSASSTSSSAACPTLPTNLQTGLVGYWPFCGNANDASGNGNNGTVNGATLTVDRFGNANSAYSFESSGNQNIAVSGVTMESEFTLSLWYQTSNYSTTINPSLCYFGLEGFGTNFTRTIDVTIDNVNYPQPFLRANLNYDFGFAGTYNSPVNWTNITVKLSNSILYFYIDNVLIQSTQVSKQALKLLASDVSRIGCANLANGAASGYFNGKIDDVAIWNRALTASEIQQLYTLGQSTYLWSTGATTATINVTPTTTTTYTCTVTDANGNVCTDSVTVFVPQIEATDLTICAGETTTLSVSGINSTATNSECPTLPTNLQTGLVGYWPFCGNANDASGNGNNGVVTGASLSTDRNGAANSSYSFSTLNWAPGSQLNEIFIPYNPSFNASNISVFSWIKPLDYGWPGSGASIVRRFQGGYSNPNGQSWVLELDVANTGQVRSWIFAPSNNNSQTNVNHNGSIVPINQWSYVGFTFDGTNLKTYLNGVIESTTVAPQGFLANAMGTSGISIGISNQANGFWFPYNGLIDDVTFHNRALSSSEVAQLFNQSSSTYLWSTGATTPTINVSPTTTTTYTCTITTDGVSCTDSVTVVVNNPVIDLGGDVTVCGTSTTLTAPSGYDSYLWSNSATTNSTTVSANGTYSCTVTQGGCSATDSIDVTLIDATITASDTTICAGETVTLSVPQGGSTNSACAALPTNLQTGLVGYWPFCGNANDASGNGNNGTVNGATLTADRFGNANSAYAFDGVNDLINVSLNSISNTYPANAEITTNVWIKTSENHGPVVSFQGVGGYEYDLHVGTLADIVQSPGHYGMFLRDNCCGTGNNLFGSSVNNSQWQMLTVVRGADGALKLYLNGLLDSFSGPGSSGSLIFTNPYLNFGADQSWITGAAAGGCNSCNDLDRRYFLGLIDDISSYSRALTPSEIQQIYTLEQTSYFWSNGATTPTINVSPTSTTTYTCTVTTNGVSCTDSVTVVVSNPVIDLGADVTVCGTSTTLTAPSGYESYLWSNGGTTNTTTVSANGTYSCTATQGGCSANDSIYVTLIDATITASDSIICAGEITTLSVNAIPSSTFNSVLFPNTVLFNGHFYSKYTGTANWFNAKTICETNGGYLAIPNSIAESDFIQVLSGFDQPATWIGLSDQAAEGTWIDVQGNPVTFFNWYPGEPNNVGDEDFVYIYNQGTALGGWNDSHPNYLLPFVLETNSIPSQILWSNGATTPTINVSPTTTTTYTCTVTTNGVSCTDSVTVVVSQPLASITPNGIVEICQGQSIALTANGGTSYLWNTGAPTQSITVNTEALYTVTVTDANGCTDTESQYVKVNQLPTIGVNNASICSGQSTTLTATGGLSYAWSPATGLSSTTGTTVAASPSTSTVYSVTGTGANGCTSTATAAVTVNALPTATITPATATTFCQGGSVVLNANTGTGLSYQWYNNAAIISGATSASYTANASGSYTVVVTNASTCSATSTATVVTVNALPTATITPATVTTFCQGGSVVLNANTGTGLSYQWYNNASAISGATSASYTANASGSYTVVVTNASTCSATSTATVVTVNALPTATIAAATATIFCQGGSVVLNANTGAGLSYQWRLNGNPISGATSSSYTANASGSYTVEVTNTSTCSATSAATVVTVNALPTATITPATATTFCQVGSVVLNANTGTGLSYQWRLNGTNITGATSSSYTANASGSYTVVVTNTSTCSATSTATVVTVNALPTATISPANATTFCQGGSVVLNANTGTGLTYQWYNNAAIISGATSASYTANASGSYTVVVTNTSTCSATSAATVVTVNALPTATITPATATTFCQGGSVVLNANTGTGLSYQWRLNGTNITGATSSSYTANASGSYTVVVTNTSTCSATSTATVVTVNALPTATISPATATTFCQGGSVVLNANTGTGLTYQWYNNAVAISGATTSSYTANSSGSYTVVVTNASTCSATSSATVVTVNALPTATITPVTATTFCQGGSVVLNANTGAGLSYQWYNNAAIISGATSASYTANASGSYTVVVTNASACSSTSTATVVTVNTLPNATITPATATTFCQGGSVVLNANTGAGLSYQWRLNGTNIIGATSSSYTANASGSYTVVVTNASTCYATSTATVVTVVPNVDYFADVDGDGFGDPATLVSTCIQPQGYVTDNTDCDDTSADVNPAVAELCNHIDDDCSGTIDDGLVFNTYYADADGDTYGDANNSIYECSQPDGYVTNNTDCNDNNANQNAASAEICNGEDDDCDGAIDNGLIFLDYYADLDSDGFGAGVATNSCVDLGAGYVTNNTDCNDNNVNQNAASAEICNGEDDDCDGQIDNGVTFLDYYADTDGDGFGAGDVISSCSDLGAGYVSNNTDCDDTNSSANPSATETCNTIDDNCDGQIDEGVQTVYFIDNDGDTYGNPSVSILACTQPAGYTPDDTDCNDTDANINPGAEDIAGNGIDENCDGQIDNSIFELNATISLYPNPTRSELNIQVNSSIIGNDLYIFDAVGKLVHKQQLLSTQTTLPVSNFADGNYVVKVGEVVKRFVVQK